MGHGGPSPGASQPCVEGSLPGLAFCNTQLPRLSAVWGFNQIANLFSCCPGELASDFPSCLAECRARAGQNSRKCWVNPAQSLSFP